MNQEPMRIMQPDVTEEGSNWLEFFGMCTLFASVLFGGVYAKFAEVGCPRYEFRASHWATPATRYAISAKHRLGAAAAAVAESQMGDARREADAALHCVVPLAEDDFDAQVIWRVQDVLVRYHEARDDRRRAELIPRLSQELDSIVRDIAWKHPTYRTW